jgi:hypothetical protein
MFAKETSDEVETVTILDRIIEILFDVILAEFK